jgi:hypothetical protein
MRQPLKEETTMLPLRLLRSLWRAPLALLVVGAAALTALWLPACPNTSATVTGCQSDFECGEFQRCEASRGVCLCRDDNACDSTEFCNLAGFCQQRSECLTNDDCRSAENPNGLCDVNTGECVTLGPTLQCTRDSQCGFGNICQAGICVASCRENGDCPLSQPCLDGSCSSTPGACNEVGYCEFGQFCDVAARTCRDHAARNQLCQRCGPRNPTACADDCLIDSSVAPTACSNDSQCERGFCEGRPCFSNSECGAGNTCNGAFIFVPGTCSNKTCQDFFCGSSGCSESNPCPRGYNCNSLQVVTDRRCTLGSGSAECGAPRSCVGGGETGNVGICSCASDADCPVFNGRQTTCVNPGPNGACLIGTTCAPADGLLCEDFR